MAQLLETGKAEVPLSKEFSIPIDNRLLAALLRDEYDRLLPSLETVRLPKNRILYEAGDTVRHAYFPNNGLTCLLSITEDGHSIDTGMVGQEGFIGVPLIQQVAVMPTRVMVQVPSEAFKIEARALLAEFNRCGKLHEVLLRYTYVLQVQAVQSAVCNRFHTVQDRLCRWLLVTSDCLHSDSFDLRQEHIANMLGHQRHRISLAALVLRKKGLIEYGGGRIKILDRPGLETSACECYGIVSKTINTFLEL